MKIKLSHFLLFFSLFYYIAAAILAFWGATAGFGLPGWLVAWELENLDTASLKLSAFLALIVYSLPMVAVMVLVYRLAPKSFNVFTESIRHANPDPASPAPDLRAIKTWKGIGILTLVLTGLTALTAVFFYIRDQRINSSSVLRIDIRELATKKPDRWQRVEIKAFIPRGYYAAYREQNTNHVYLPLTPPGWSKSAPITAFVHCENYGPSNSEIVLPPQLAHPGNVTAAGLPGDAMPIFAQRMFRAKGATLAVNPLIVDWNTDTGRRQIEAIPDTVLGALVIGAFITSIAVPITIASKTGIIGAGPSIWQLTGFEGTWVEDSAENPKELAIYWGRDVRLHAAEVLRHGDIVIRRLAPIEADRKNLYLDTTSLWGFPSAYTKINSKQMQQQGGALWNKTSSTVT